jgi:5-methylcytosine-specific restriction endonuclease McrA
MSNNPAICIHRLSMYPKKPKEPEWRERYNAHLDSHKWQELRGKVFERQGGICAGCEAAAVEHVHHLTYAHMGDEFLFELLGLCIDCHLKLHDRHPNDCQGFK